MALPDGHTIKHNLVLNAVPPGHTITNIHLTFYLRGVCVSINEPWDDELPSKVRQLYPLRHEVGHGLLRAIIVHVVHAEYRTIVFHHNSRIQKHLAEGSNRDQGERGFVSTSEGFARDLLSFVHD